MTHKIKFAFRLKKKIITKKNINYKAHSGKANSGKANSEKANVDNNNDDNDSGNNETKSFTIRFASNKFLSHTQSIIKPGPKLKINKKDLFAIFITDNKSNLIDGKVIYNKKLDKYIFNENNLKCICKNILNYKVAKPLPDDCECDYMKTYSSQGKSGANIYSIRCGKKNEVLKVVSLSEYYMKMRAETIKYFFLEMDSFSLQTVINNYLYKELPNNTINIINSGVCINNGKILYDRKILHGYNLLEEADFGNGKQFFMKLISGLYDNELDIDNEDDRYIAITNFLLQSILIIGHLQSSKLEFFHGDYKPENVFVKKTNVNNKNNKNYLKYFTFNIFGKEIKIKNIGFVVLIADFDKSSITLEDEFSSKKYRLVPPVVYKILLFSSVNNMIKKYGDVDPDSDVDSNGFGKVEIEKLFISKLVSKKLNPTISILRSSGLKLFRDFDLYMFFIKLLENVRTRDYILAKRYDVTILSFMSNKFIKTLYSMPVKEMNLNESVHTIVDIFDKIKEPMNNVFSNNYIEKLKALNYRLFR